jgi:outer membrane receptor for ferrienterochelin and colicins
MPCARISTVRPGKAFRRGLFAFGAALLALPDAGQAQAVNYAELQDLFSEPVTTSATGKPQRASEAPAALVIITRDDIRRSPAHDIPGLLQAYAGIDVARWTAGQSDIAIRGGVQAYNPRLLVLVNGRQAYLDHYGMTNWAGLGVQLEEIQQIEVVKGPNSALFGFNAVSGVINIITIDPLHSQGVTVTGGIGTEGQYFASGVASVKLGANAGLRLSGGYDSADELRAISRSALAPQPGPVSFRPRHEEGAAEIYAQLGERTKGSLSITHSYSQQLDLTPPLLTLPTSYRFTSAGGRISHDTGWGVLSARLFQNWSEIETFFVPGLEFHNKVLVASADALVRAGSANTMRLGIEYRSNELKQKPGYPGATRYDILAASGMWETRLSDAVTFTVAGRVDHLKLEQEGVVDQPTIFTKADFDRSITEWSFNGALLVKPDDRNTLRIAAGRGVWLPSLFNFGARLDLAVPGLPISSLVAGDPHIDPAKIWSGEIGLSHMLGESGNRLELTAFYNLTSDAISSVAIQTQPRAAPPAYPFILASSANVGTFEAYGLEASVSGRFDPAWTWSLNYTWTHADQRIAGNANGHFDRPLALDTGTPEHKVKAQVSYEGGPWLATAALRYTSATRQLVTSALDPNGPLALVPVADSMAVDAKLAFKVNDRLTFAITGENLTGADGAYLSPAAAERRIRVSLRAGF